MTVLSLKIVDVGCFISHQHYVGSNHWKFGCLFKSLFRLTTKKYVLVNTQHKGTWRGASMFSLICAWINVWVINREAGDLRRHQAHYDVIVMLESLVRYPDFVPRSFIIIGVFRSIPNSVAFHDTAVKVHNIKICSGIIKKASLGCCTEVNFAVFINNV